MSRPGRRLTLQTQQQRAERVALSAVRRCVTEYLDYFERCGRLPNSKTIRTIPQLIAYSVLQPREATSR